MNNARVFKLLSGPERKCLLPASVTGYQQLIHNSAGLCTCHWPVGLLKGLFWFPSHTSQPQLAARVSLSSHDWWVTDVFVNPAAVVYMCVCATMWNVDFLPLKISSVWETRAKSQMRFENMKPLSRLFQFVNNIFFILSYFIQTGMHNITVPCWLLENSTNAHANLIFNNPNNLITFKYIKQNCDA